MNLRRDKHGVRHYALNFLVSKSADDQQGALLLKQLQTTSSDTVLCRVNDKSFRQEAAAPTPGEDPNSDTLHAHRTRLPRCREELPAAELLRVL